MKIPVRWTGAVVAGLGAVATIADPLVGQAQAAVARADGAQAALSAADARAMASSARTEGGGCAPLKI